MGSHELPLTDDETRDLEAWVLEQGGYAGKHRRPEGTCRNCGDPESWHEHYRPGTDCTCGCPSYR